MTLTMKEPGTKGIVRIAVQQFSGPEDWEWGTVGTSSWPASFHLVMAFFATRGVDTAIHRRAMRFHRGSSNTSLGLGPRTGPVEVLGVPFEDRYCRERMNRG